MRNKTTFSSKNEGPGVLPTISKYNFARQTNKNKQIRHKSTSKNTMPNSILGSDKIKEVSLFEFKDKKYVIRLIKHLYPIFKHYIKKDKIFDSKTSPGYFLQYIIQEFIDNNNYEYWNIIIEDVDVYVMVGDTNDASTTGHCTELNWIEKQKKDFKNLIYDFIGYLYNKYDIPVLDDIEVYTDMAEEFIWGEDDEDVEIKDQLQIIKFYQDKIPKIKSRITKSKVSYEQLIYRINNIKCKNFKDKQIRNWMLKGLEVVKTNFMDYIPYNLFDEDDEEYNGFFGPSLYCNMMWTIDEMDPVFAAYDGQMQSFYNEYNIVPFTKQVRLTENNPKPDLTDDYPNEFCNWLDSTYLLYS